MKGILKLLPPLVVLSPAPYTMRENEYFVCKVGYVCNQAVKGPFVKGQNVR